MNVFDLVASLKLDSSEYEKNLSSAKSEGESFGSKLGSALGTAGKVAGATITAVGTAVGAVSAKFVSSAKATADYGDEIDKTSQKLGVSAKTYQEYDYIMNLAGTSMSDMTVGMKTLTNQLDNAINGTEASQQMFEKLGFSMEDLSNMSREDLFKETIASLQNMEDSTERASLANDLFGKSGQNLTPLFNMTNAETQELIGNLNDMGAVLSDEAVKASADFEDALTTLQKSISGLKNGTMAEFLPACTKIMDGLTAIFSGDSSGIQMITEGIDDLVTGLTEAIPEIMDVAVEIVKSLAEAIIENLPQLVECATDIVMELANFVIENLPMLIETALQIIITLANGIIEALPTLIPTIVDVVLQIVTTLIDNIDLLIDGAIALITALAEGLINSLPILIEKAPEIIIKLVDALIRNLPKLLKACAELIKTLWNGIITNLPTLLAKVPQIITGIKDKLLEGLSKIKDVGKNLIEGLWDGINDKIQWIKDKISGFGDEILGKIKDIFGVHSPSTVFAEIGGYLAEGLGVGWDDEIDDVKKDINSSLNFSASMGNPSTSTMTANTQPIIVQSEVELGVNAKKMLNIISQQNRIETRATGYNQLALARG